MQTGGLAYHPDDRIIGRLSSLPGHLVTISRLVEENTASTEIQDDHPDDGSRRLRMTTRQLMILVAIAGVSLGVARVWQRRTFCLKMAAYHGQYEVLHSGGVPADMNPDDISVFMAVMRPQKESAAFHARMRQK
jgi:hypothetical protein